MVNSSMHMHIQSLGRSDISYDCPLSPLLEHLFMAQVEPPGLEPTSLAASYVQRPNTMS